MSRKLQASIVSAAFGTLIVSLLVVGFLFRQRAVNYPELGLTTYKWRWGRAAVLENDTNRDGLVDFRAEFSRWSTEFSIHEPIMKLGSPRGAAARMLRQVSPRFFAIKCHFVAPVTVPVDLQRDDLSVRISD